jgi:hypothetical protein
MLGTKLACSTAYHPQTDGLAERIIQTLEDMIRRFCAYGLDFKDNDGYTHDWVSLIPILELAYSTSIHSTTGKAPSLLEKGWIPNITSPKTSSSKHKLISTPLLAYMPRCLIMQGNMRNNALWNPLIITRRDGTKVTENLNSK